MERTNTKKTNTVGRRESLSLELEEILATAKTETVDGLDDFLSPILTGEERGALEVSLDLYRRRMAWARKSLAEADETYLEGVARDAELCARRESLTAGLVGKLVNLHRTCRGYLGEEDLHVLGLDGRTARRPKAVLQQSRSIATSLEQLDLDLDCPEWPDMMTWLKQQARLLLPDIRELSRTMQAIDEQRRQTRADAAARKQVIADFDCSYLAIGNVVEGMLRMAGLDAEADRVHPSVRRLLRKEEGAVDGLPP